MNEVSTPLDHKQPSQEQTLRKIIVWWERRRWWYNVLVGITGFMVLWIGTPMGQLLAGGWWVEILLYGLLANIAFTGGWAIEWILIRFAHLNPWPGIVREILYFSGTVFSILLTYWIARWFVFKLLQLQWSFF